MTPLILSRAHHVGLIDFIEVNQRPQTGKKEGEREEEERKEGTKERRKKEGKMSFIHEAHGVRTEMHSW